MQTSYFAKSGNNPRAVAISNGTKGFDRIRKCEALIPPWWLVDQLKRKETTAEEFTRIYRAQLDKLNPRLIAAQLGDEAILLCWEKPGDFCHRRIVADWLKETMDMNVPEIGYTPVEQDSLF